MEVVYIRPKQVEAFYGIPESTQKVLRYKAVHGLDPHPIPFVKRGRTVLYKVVDLIRWLEAKLKPANSDDPAPAVVNESRWSKPK